MEPLQYRSYSHIKDNKSGMKLAREKDLRGYLKHHNHKMADTAEEIFRQEQIYKHLMNGVSMSVVPEKEVNDNIMFTGPVKNQRSKRRGNKFVKEVYKTARFPNAVEVISKYDKDNRWAAGVNANTLMTEYRRKVLFHALLNTGDVDEDRADSQAKVKRYLAVNHPEELVEEDRIALEETDSVSDPLNGTDSMIKEHKEREALEREMAAKSWQHTLRGRDNPKGGGGDMDVTAPAVREVLAEEFSITGKYSNYINGSESRLSTGGSHNPKDTARPLSTTIKDPASNFNPKIDDYDVMHNRWRYIKPELTSLLPRKTMAPNVITRQVHSEVSGSTVTGAFRDVVGYEDIYTKSQLRAISCDSFRENKSVNTLSQRYSMTSLSNKSDSSVKIDTLNSRASTPVFVEQLIPTSSKPSTPERKWRKV